MDPRKARIRHPVDIGAALQQFFLDTVVASVDMINPVNHGLLAGHEPRKDQTGRGRKSVAITDAPSSFDMRELSSTSIASSAGSSSSEAGSIPQAEERLLTDFRSRSNSSLSSDRRVFLKDDQYSALLSILSLQVGTVLPMGP